MHPLRQLCLAAVFALGVWQFALADPPAARQFDPDRFNALTAEQKVSFVLSVLDARDRELSNFKYALRETCTNVDKETGDRRFMFNSDYEVRRLGPRLWMHLTNYEFGSDEDEIRSEGTVTWDGKLAVNLVTPRTARATHNTASVRDRPNDNFWLKKFNELLGLRVQVGNGGVPLTDFLRSASTRKDPIVVHSDRRRPDVTEIKVEVRRGDDRWSFWLDPRHDYMISRFEYRYERNADYMAHHEEVVVPFQVNGVWVPREALHVTETSAYHERSEFKYQVTTFEIGSVKPADVEIPFPSGTRVTDMVYQVAYTVLPDGRRRLEPLALPDKQTLRVPPKDPVTSLPVAEAAKLYTSEVLNTVEPPKASQKSNDDRP
jgi:hypothetical protein